jgi:hypothetical protein
MEKIILVAAIVIAIAGFSFAYQSGLFTKETGSNTSQPNTFTSVSSVPTSCTSVNGLPDPKCTPGAIDTTVTQNSINDTICVSGYTQTVRSSVSYTEPLKIQLMQSYGFSDSLSNYELDHLIPLEVGGAPSAVKNLWPEPRYGEPNSIEKDRFENYLHDQVCSGVMNLQEAQKEISTNWFDYWDKAGRPLGVG